MVNSKDEVLCRDPVLIVLHVHGKCIGCGLGEVTGFPANVSKHRLALIILGPVSWAVGLDELPTVDRDGLDLAIGIKRHHLKGELAWHRQKVSRGRRGAYDHRRQVAGGKGDPHRFRSALGPAIVSDCGT